MNVSAGMGTFKVDVHTTQNRGFTPEELSQLCCDKIVAVSSVAPDVIKQQAEAFQKQIQTENLTCLLVTTLCVRVLKQSLCKLFTTFQLAVGIPLSWLFTPIPPYPLISVVLDQL